MSYDICLTTHILGFTLRPSLRAAFSGYPRSYTMSASLGNGTYHPASITFWDKSREKGTMEVYGLPVTSVNFTTISGLWASVISASIALANGLIYSQRWVNLFIANAYPPDDDITQEAVREIGLKVLYIDSTTQKKFEATLPTLNLSLVTYLSQAKDFVAVTAEQGAGAEVIAFVGAFEGFVVNPNTGNGTTVVGLKVVGKNT